MFSPFYIKYDFMIFASHLSQQLWVWNTSHRGGRVRVQYRKSCRAWSCHRLQHVQPPNLSMAVTVVTLNVAPSERSALVSAPRATGRREKLLVDHL